jgi:sigma-B regulation protein RsbU (phosphoserine phosphatase)
MKKKGIAYRLSIYILTATTLLFLLIVFYNYHVAKNLLIKHAEKSARHSSNSVVNKIENILTIAEKIPENISHLLNVSLIEKGKIIHLLKATVEENTEIFGSAIAFGPYAYNKDSLYFSPYCYRSGTKILQTYLGGDNYKYFYFDWYQLPVMLKKPLWTEPYFDKNGGNIIMSTYSVPFYYKGSNQVSGVVTADVSLTWLEKIISSTEIAETGYAFILSGKGNIISHPDTSLIMNESIFSLADELSRPDLREIGRKMISGETNFVRIDDIRSDRKAWLYYTPIPVNKWTFGVIIPEKQLLASISQLTKRLLVMGCISFIILQSLIIFITRGITAPLASLAALAKKIGSGDFTVSIPDIHRNDEIGTLSASFRNMQQELATYVQNLQKTTAAKEKIESELMIARQLQMSIIPKVFPPFPERSDIDIYAALIPAREVGGDLYDYFFIDNDHLCFYIGDVSGKGVPASLLMVILITLFRANRKLSGNVSDLASSINQTICRNNESSMFVTLFIGILNVKNGELVYLNAGHNPPLILRRDGSLTRCSKIHGPPIGVLTGLIYGSATDQVAEGEALLLYTDGVTEAENKKQELFSGSRLETFLNRCLLKTPEIITNDLLAEIHGFSDGAEQSDDITILALKRYTTGSVNNINTLGSFYYELRNELTELRQLEEILEKVGDAFSISQNILFKINMAITEHFSNIVMYAYSDKLVHLIGLHFELSGQYISITVTDDGTAFNPAEQKKPAGIDLPLEEKPVGGLGIYLLKTIMDGVFYERKGIYNVLTMKKSITQTA